ncbi:MAG: septum site-determining protein MinC [Amaricoccus sp.]
MNVQSLESPEAAAVGAVVQPLQVRGRSFTAVAIRLPATADKAFFDALETLMRQAPHFFVNAPLVLDLEEAPDIVAKADFVKLARQLRARRLIAVGVQNATPEQGTAAFGAGLVTLQNGRDVAIERGAKAAMAKAPEPAKAEAPAASLLVTEPVRSGQRIFAERGDLVVMTAVSSGAELIARGHIHIYGPLRGRALAGVDGDLSARIFCQSLEAELIAVAGLYRTSEDFPADVRGKRVQAFLKDDALTIEPVK